MPHESSCNTQEYIRVRVEEAGETASSSSAVGAPGLCRGTEFVAVDVYSC